MLLLLPSFDTARKYTFWYWSVTLSTSFTCSATRGEYSWVSQEAPPLLEYSNSPLEACLPTAATKDGLVLEKAAE